MGVMEFMAQSSFTDSSGPESYVPMVASTKCKVNTEFSEIRNNTKEETQLSSSF
jgi:hypothetical protein